VTIVQQRPTPLEWNIVVGTGLLRIAAGTLLLRRRDWLIRMAGGSPEDRLSRALFTYFGCRDLALGVAAIAATKPGGSAPGVLVAQGVADTSDTAVLSAVRATGRFPGWRGAGMSAMAGGTAIAEYAAAYAVKRRVG
jgi:hypothetical protein